ncbi:NAD(P)-dependent alcohol dehydrogenase [Kineosporia sp. J2-2]|uniref:alcohol dehydrogenase (NADP(+)) n=1 Tax=Kineosporia corallincola TaxID=2835133 RepID=A0ABS5TLN4_9ACTN|nr:NAD(P)-dependent alcohol dehydrogenase [Kineosporia corallincola]MBT0771996.1 NAD(P)-dependent alcohol dehydrogenase [Kineosporia corallincola]
MTTGYALLTPGGTLQPWTFGLRATRPDDVRVRITHCGVCHSDLHAIEAADGLPLVPGHEFTGEVAEIGSAVTEFAVGDRVAVGNIVDSCGVCPACLDEEETYCLEFPTLTYGGVDRHDGTPRHGAYARETVVRDRFVYHLPEELDPAGAAPLMCAGVTMWQPLRRLGVGAGTRVGVAGLGGLGHLAVKFARALGASVTVFTTSRSRREQALALGAEAVVLSTDPDQMARHAYAFDVIVDTVPGEHDLTPYLLTLDFDGTLCVLGIPPRHQVDAMALLRGRRRVTASGSSGVRDAREMLAFAAEHGITADVEVLPAPRVREALDRLARGDVRGRLVLDLTVTDEAPIVAG